jgi:CheY-like chemotaxis protein
MKTPVADLSGTRVLVVEDVYVIADDLCRVLEAAGAQVIGPVPSVGEAMDLLARETAITGAVLDVDLNGTKVFPLADLLGSLGVPFVFVTGYGENMIPEAHAHVPRCEKPADAKAVIGALFSERMMQ